jgi:formate dehydrogenase subunit delta
MQIDYLVRMANDIGRFFAAEPDQEQAAQEIVSHIKRFWDPRMRSRIIEHYRAGGEGLADLVRRAIGLLADESAARHG